MRKRLSPAAAVAPRRAVFLDRDGTLNVDKGYVHAYRDWDWIPGAIDAIRLLNRNGYLAVVVSNQAGIARGSYSAHAVTALHARVAAELKRHGAHIDAFYFCPHHPQFGAVRDCDCRKPKPGLLLRAQSELGIALEQSFLIGDKLSDIEAGQAAGVRPLLVSTGYGSEHSRAAGAPSRVFADVLAAARFITNEDQKSPPSPATVARAPVRR